MFKEEVQIGLCVGGQMNMLCVNFGVGLLIENLMLVVVVKVYVCDMLVQNCVWYFGLDGLLFLDWIWCQGYMGQLVGENIFEIYENDVIMLNVWMQVCDICDVIMDGKVIEFGMGWY